MFTTTTIKQEIVPSDLEALPQHAGRLFFSLCLTLGLLYAFLMPPFLIPDEIGHFIRAHGISKGACISGVETPIPSAALDALRHFQAPGNGPPPPVAAELEFLWPKLMQADQGAEESGHRNPAPNLYSCVPYLPAAAAISVGRSMSVSVLVQMYLARLANLVCFAVMTWAAVKLISSLYLPMLALCLMPMTLHQAASVSADAITIGSTFLLCAAVLRFCLEPVGPRLTRREIGILMFSGVVSALCKFNLWLLLLVLLIPKGRFTSAQQRALILCSFLVLTTTIPLSWQYVNQSNIEHFAVAKKATGNDVAANMQFVRSNPLVFLHLVAYTLSEYWKIYLWMFVGYLGWLNIPLPRWLVWSYSGLLVVLAVTQVRRSQLGIGRSIAIFGLLIGSVVSMFALLWGFEASPDQLQLVRTGAMTLLPGVQGRYFIPLALPAIAVLSVFALPLRIRGVLPVTVASILGANGVAIWTITHPAYSHMEMPVAAKDTMSPAGPIAAGHRFSQSFQATWRGLNKVEVCIATYSRRIPSGKLVLRLYSATDPMVALATTEVAADRIDDNGFIGLSFPPIRDSIRKVYIIEVEAVDLPSATPITTWRTVTDLYPDGEFSVDGVTQPYDAQIRVFAEGY